MTKNDKIALIIAFLEQSDSIDIVHTGSVVDLDIDSGKRIFSAETLIVQIQKEAFVANSYEDPKDKWE